MNLIIKRTTLVLGLMALLSLQASALMTIKVINESSTELEFYHKLDPVEVIQAKGGMHVVENVEKLIYAYFRYHADLVKKPQATLKSAMIPVAAIVRSPDHSNHITGLPVLFFVEKDRGLPKFLNWIPEWLYSGEDDSTYIIRIKDYMTARDEL